MSADDRLRWDRQHAESSGPEEASGFLREIFAGEHWQIPAGRALDIACGKGRNALFLAARGFDVTALDVSAVALSEGRRRAEERKLKIDWLEIDLEKEGLPGSDYDLIVDINYLQRALLPQIKAAVKPGGFVIFETYLIDQQTIGHPKNPDYLLGHNELLNAFSSFRVLLYREGKFTDGREPSFRAGILAQKLR
ncbi:MAG: class I SAM-dependent methyltransferase [Chloroflexota bacterium]